MKNKIKNISNILAPYIFIAGFWSMVIGSLILISNPNLWISKQECQRTSKTTTIVDSDEDSYSDSDYSSGHSIFSPTYRPHINPMNGRLNIGSRSDMWHHTSSLMKSGYRH